jgi:hypothetical protein
MSILYYRHIVEVLKRNQLVAERKILSVNSASGFVTWYTPTRYDDPLIAQRELALPSTIISMYRAGPIPETLMPPLSTGPRRVAPAFGHPGGGLEVSTNEPVWLLGLWSFAIRAFDSNL